MYSLKLRKFPGLGPPPSWPVARAPTVSVPIRAVLKLEVLPPCPAGCGYGIGALGSLLVVPSQALSVSVADQSWLPPWSGPGKGKSRGKERVRTRGEGVRQEKVMGGQ